MRNYQDKNKFIQKPTIFHRAILIKHKGVKKDYYEFKEHYRRTKEQEKYEKITNDFIS